MIRGFIKDELHIYHKLELGNVHRFGTGAQPGKRGRPRPIVARFIYHNDLAMVMSNTYRLKGKQYGVNKQFPEAIEQARKSLYPIMKEMKAEGHRVRLVRDILYVDGVIYNNQTLNSPSPKNRREVLNTPEDYQSRKRRRRESRNSTDHSYGAPEKNKCNGMTNLPDSEQYLTRTSNCKINMLTLNCCGVIKRMHYPEFIDMVQEFDFISLVETKTDDLDKINIPGFTFHLKNRKNIARVKSGGIAFGYKSHLENFVKPVENFSSLVYWWKISSDLLKTDQDVMMGNIYIPPENSVYKVPDAFNELEQEFLKFSVEYKYILLNGDFNSRTSRDVEYIEIVHSQHDIVDTDNVDILNNLELYDMSKVRCSMDTSKNSYGNMLLEMCKNNNIIILNGRVNGDKEGKFTCRQASVVDYFICTYDFLCFVVNMYVQDFSKLFSDVHSPLILSLNFIFLSI
ncbi:unnamed protein product [Mytilus edulis]|uniref:Endonuclease/exonuclease/phosphatase domain-containing protein n=1 Tax=Mytilus edulis TaxID=6550 RepID=A0A8S3TD47_MYTED|nr:unnamed protein product [Mytilus edulis]